MHVLSSPVTAALISQGEVGGIKRREITWSQEGKVWTGKEGMYRKQASDGWANPIGE